MSAVTPMASSQEDLPEPELRPSPVARRSGVPSTYGGLIYLIVLAVVGIGVLVLAAGAFRIGLGVMGAALGSAAVARLVLSRSEAGMLGLRRKSLDVLLLSSLAAGLIILAVAIPDAPA